MGEKNNSLKTENYKEDPVYWTEPRELTLGATWKNRQQEAATSAGDASVFGNLGVLLGSVNQFFKRFLGITPARTEL